MNRILPAVLFIIFSVHSGLSPLYAQSDSSSRRKQQERMRLIDSEKNVLLSRQSDEYQVVKADRVMDSIRLQELKQEMQQLGKKDNTKKLALSAESDQIRIKDSVRNVVQKLKIDSLRSRVNGFPVYLPYDTLFYIFSKQGSFSPRERAEAVSKRLLKLLDDYYFSPDSLIITQSEYTTDILYSGEIITAISDEDAIWKNSTKEQLADQYRTIIIAGIQKYKTENSVQSLIRDILLSLLVLFVLVLIIYSINRIFKWIKFRIEKQRGDKIRGIKIKNYEFLDTAHQVKAIFTLFNFLKWTIILILIYLSLPVLLGIFPWTGGYASKLFSYFLDPIKGILVSIWHYLPNFFTIIVLIFFFRYFLRILHYFKSEIERGVLKIPGFYVDWANPTFQIIRVLILAFMVIVIFPYLPGSDSQVFKGVSVFLGVLFTFGSAGALGNIVAGLVLTYMRAFKIGDRVKIGEANGDVVEKSLLMTRIKTIKNEIISIPNSTVMASHTTNFSAVALDNGLILHTTVTIGYDTPWRQVHDLLIKAALATDLVEKDPAPFVFQTSLDDFFVSYQINAYTKVANRQHVTYSELHKNIQDTFNEAGVEIMSSHYSNVRDGNQSTVPADHLPKDYITPSFRVKQTGDEDPS
jgi:small-conductance mechanosensitive channel